MRVPVVRNPLPSSGESRANPTSLPQAAGCIRVGAPPSPRLATPSSPRDTARSPARNRADGDIELGARQEELDLAHVGGKADEREIAVIIIINSKWHSAYPTNAHERRGKEVGLPAGEVEAMLSGPGSAVRQRRI